MTPATAQRPQALGCGQIVGSLLDDPLDDAGHSAEAGRQWPSEGGILSQQPQAVLGLGESVIFSMAQPMP